MSRLQQLFRQYQNRTGFILLCLFVLLLADFGLRLYVPLNSSGLLPVAALPSTQPTAGKLTWTAPMQQWFDSAVTSTANPDATAEQAVEMTGASQLGALQVRVRAIFIRPDQPDEAIALIESYQQTDKQHQIERYRVGDTLGDYQLASIEQHQVAFKATSNTEDTTTVVIPVFNFNSGNS